MSRVRFALAGAACALVVSSVAAPSALAGRVLYSAAPGTGYTVTAEGHGQGIVKITVTQCLVAGQTFALPLRVTAQQPYKGTPSATWKVMKDGSAAPAFNPASVTFDQPTKDVTLTLTAGTPSNKGDFLRFKLAPDAGSGLGEGPGYMVRYACVLASGGDTARLSCPPVAQTRAKGGNGNGQAKKEDNPGNGQANGNGNGGVGNGKGNGNAAPPSAAATAPDDPVCPVPPPPPPGTEPQIPTSGVVQGSTVNAARCISLPRQLRVTAGEQNLVRVVIRENGINISNAIVRVQTPDGIITKRTNALGVALFRVRPSKAGRITVRSDVCFGLSRSVVRGSHVVVRRATPQFTG